MAHDKHHRKPSAYQKQIRFFTVLFIAVGTLLVLGLLWLLNRPRY